MPASVKTVFIASLLLGSLSSCALSNIGTHASDAILGETDHVLAADALPSILKIAETAHRTFPRNAAYRKTLASLHILYANAFLDGEAFYLMDTDYELARATQLRALQHYKRAAGLLEPLILAKNSQLLKVNLDLTASSEEALGERQRQTQKFRAGDTDLLYYFAAATLGAFSLDPLDFEVAQRVPAAFALLERALAVNPLYGGGMVRDLGFTVYASLPEALGGNREKAMSLYQEIVSDASVPISAGIHVSWALSFAAVDQDYQAFVNSLEKAIAIGTSPARASLMNSLAARKAAWLLDNAYLYIDIP